MPARQARVAGAADVLDVRAEGLRPGGDGAEAPEGLRPVEHGAVRVEAAGVDDAVQEPRARSGGEPDPVASRVAHAHARAELGEGARGLQEGARRGGGLGAELVGERQPLGAAEVTDREAPVGAAMRRTM